MHRPWRPRSFLLPAALLALTMAAGQAKAQSVVFSGKVMSQAGQPLAGANIAIPELGVGGVATPEGRYSFTVDESRVRGRTLNLVARYIGYKPVRVALNNVTGRVDHDFILERDVLNLEEVVSTGTSQATSQKKTAFAVGVVDNTQLKEVPSTSSPVAVLAGKIPGASVVSSSGQPGAAPAIRLRSATSLTGRQDPLVIVDGTITRLSLADINSEDIERVEVIKGAAASSLYGSDAANGVIQIFTKRGANLGDGQTSFTVRTELGQNKLPHIVPTNMHHNYELNPDGSFALSQGNRIPKPDKIVDNPYPVVYDQYPLVFRPGNVMTNYVSYGERRGTTNFNASFENTHDQGVLAMLDGFRRQNFRVNVDQALTDKLNLGVGAFYGRSNADQGEDTGIFFGMRFLEPNIKIDSVPQSGSFAGMYNPKVKQPPLSGNVSNPLYVLQQRKISQGRDRFTGTFKAAYQAMNWLTFNGNVGYDVDAQNYKSYTPIGFANSAGAQGPGGLSESSQNDRAYNMGVDATANSQWGDIHNTTKAAFLYEDETNSGLSVGVDNLAVNGVTELSATNRLKANIGPGSFTDITRAKNAFLVTTFDIKDRYILDGLVRRDQSSLFGAQERAQTYHRVSAAYRVTEDFKIPFVQELKLRASHGTAGLRPPYEAQYETFALQGGTLVPNVLGNQFLKPAFSRETEYGFDAQVLNNLSFEYTYSKKRTTDEIIKVPLSVAAYGYQFQWQNAGSLDGSSHEAALGVVLLSKADYFWRMNFTADRTRQTISDLKVGAFMVGPSESTSNTQIFRIAAGEPFGVIYGSEWIRTEAQLAETIKTGRLSGTVGDYTKNEEGFYVRTSQYHTINEVPLKAYFCANTDCTQSKSVVQIGNVNPDFNLGWTQNAQWKIFSLSSTVTWTKGGDIYNYTRQWPFNELRDAVEDQSKKPATNCPGWDPATTTDPTCPYATGKKPSTYYSAFYNNFDPNSYFVEKGSYARLRELSLNVEIPTRYVSRIPVGDFHSARIGLVGRNLWTKTKYSGFDPDVTGPGGGNPFAYRVDYFSYPAYRTFTAMLELGF